MFYWAKKNLLFLPNGISTLETVFPKFTNIWWQKSTPPSPVDMIFSLKHNPLTPSLLPYYEANGLYAYVKESLQLGGLRNWRLVVTKPLAREIFPPLLLNKSSLLFQMLSLWYFFAELHSTCFIQFPTPDSWSEKLNRCWLCTSV